MTLMVWDSSIFYVTYTFIGMIGGMLNGVERVDGEKKIRVHSESDST